MDWIKRLDSIDSIIYRTKLKRSTYFRMVKVKDIRKNNYYLLGDYMIKGENNESLL